MIAGRCGTIIQSPLDGELLLKALLHRDDMDAAQPFLERIHLDHPGTTKEFLIQQLLLLDLEERGLLKVS